MDCHQYLIRKEKELQEIIPFDKNKASLEKTTIKEITRLEAENIVKEYEYLKALAPYNIYYFAIFFNVDNIEYLGGVLVFSHEYSANKEHWKKYDFFEKIILLSRGVCLHWTPINTASFFISKVCKWLKKNTHYKVVTATTDALAGEVGIIYQSCNWYYVGLMEEEITNKYLNVSYNYINDNLRFKRYFYFIGNKYENKSFYNNIKHMIKPYPNKEDILKDFQLRINGTIYKMTNLINGKIYIGQTTRKLNVRIAEHKRCKEKSHLAQAIIKYGFDNFKVEVLFESKNMTELNEKEKYYIQYYKSYDKNIGYNKDIGGRNKIITEETRLKLSKAGKGRKQTKEHIDKRVKRGEAAKVLGRPKTEEQKKWLSENSPKFWLGKDRGEEFAEKIKQKKLLTGESMPVYLFDLEKQEIIAEYRSMTEASNLTKFTYTKVNNQCKFKNKIYSKQIFTFKKDFEQNKEKLKTLIYKRTKGT